MSSENNLTTEFNDSLNDTVPIHRSSTSAISASAISSSSSTGSGSCIPETQTAAQPTTPRGGGLSNHDSRSPTPLATYADSSAITGAAPPQENNSVGAENAEFSQESTNSGPLFSNAGSPPLLPRLRNSQSFRLDEGYGGEAAGLEEEGTFGHSHGQGGQDLDSKERSSFITAFAAGDVKVPAWMMALNDELREELAYKLVRSLPTSSIASIVERLIPVLHLDFIALLPSELSLQIFSYLPPRSLLNASRASKTWRKFALEPRLWKGLYIGEGWSLSEHEAIDFEREMRGEGRRRVQQQMDGLLRSRLVPGFSPPGATADNRAAGDSDIGSPTPSAESPMSTHQQQQNEDEHMYPAPTLPQRQNATSSMIAYPSFDPPIAPSLTTFGFSHPRLNWAYLYKNRKRLEDNWFRNRYKAFQIPDPMYAEEGHSECIYTIQYSRKYLASGSRDRTVKIWNLRTRRLVRTLNGHEGSVLCLQFDESPEEDVVFTGSSDTNIMVWKFSTGEKLKTIAKAHGESVLNLRFNKKYVVTCSKDKVIKVWSRNAIMPTDPEYLPAMQHGASRMIDPSAILRPYGGYPDLHSKPVPLPPLSLVHILSGHSAAVNAIQLENDEVVSASGDRNVKLWDLKTGLCEKTYLGHTKGIACIQYDGRQIVTGSSDKSVRVFDKASQAEIARLEGHTGLVRTVQAGGPKGARIVSGGYDETIRVWRRQDANGNLDDGENPGLYGSLREGSAWVTTGILRHVDEAPSTRAPRPHHHHHHHHHHHGGGGGGGAAAPVNGAAGAAQDPNAMLNGNAAAAAPPAWPGWNNPPPHAANAGQMAGNHPPVFQGTSVPHHQLAFAPGQAIPAQPQFQGAHHHGHFHAAGVPGVQAGPPALQGAPAVAAGVIQPPVGGGGAVASQNKVFKLQFDARFIWCCSQDTRIVGWDFAAGDPDIIEASRFF